MVTIISDKDVPYKDWFAEVLSELQESEVHGIALVALCDGENQTAYWNMSCTEKAQAEAEIRYDTVDDFIMANLDRYYPPVCGGDEFSDLLGCEDEEG